MTELKPCPFCGESPTKHTTESGEVGIICLNEQCIEVACYGRNKDHAYRLWNTRKGESHE